MVVPPRQARQFLKVRMSLPLWSRCVAKPCRSEIRVRKQRLDSSQLARLLMENSLLYGRTVKQEEYDDAATTCARVRPPGFGTGRGVMPHGLSLYKRLMSSICRRIEERRGAQVTTCRTYYGHDVRPRKEALAALGFRDIPDDLWVTVDREGAVDLLTDCLAKDLAYSVEVVPMAEARSLASAFIEQFGPDATFLTNVHKYGEASAYGWEPISRSTFDAGILVHEHGLAGIFWVTGED